MSKKKSSEMSKWISVKERLPDRNQMVLAFLPENSGRPRLARIAIETAYGDPNKCSGWLHYSRHDITHWMPLPEPPKEGGEDIPSSKFKHLCPEWDFMEIDEKDPEFDACLCFRKEELEPPKEGE